jgi:hypothetical protein
MLAHHIDIEKEVAVSSGAFMPSVLLSYLLLGFLLTPYWISLVCKGGINRT